MRTILILKGLVASGKSTFARELLAKEPRRTKRVNRDDLRAMLDDSVWTRDNEKFIRSTRDALIRSAIEQDYDIIVDDTNLVPSTLRDLHKLAESIGDVRVVEKAFNTSITDCKFRNAAREGKARVPDKAIDDMARASGIDRGRKLADQEKYYPPIYSLQAIQQDQSLPKAILCDLDGTLALVGKRSPYDATDCDIKDEPNWPVIQAVLAMWAQDIKIIFMSGREGKYRPETVRFIERYCRTLDEMTFSERTISYELYMRSAGDSRKDSIIKEELFREHVLGKYYVQAVFDDRPQVIRMWESLGLFVFKVGPLLEF